MSLLFRLTENIMAFTHQANWSHGEFSYAIRSVVLLIFLSCSIPAHSVSDWFPFPVEIREQGNPVQKAQYRPLEQAGNNWDICVVFPHMKDSYWLAVNFGIAEEVRRQGARMRLYKADGYDDLTQQRQQIKNCIENGWHGVIVGAISFYGLNDLIQELVEKNIPVIDLVNGISAPNVDARSLVSFEEMGFKAGTYLANRHRENNGQVQVAWFPGPKDAGWVLAGDKGFKKAIQGSQIKIVTSRYGDTGKKAQEDLLLDVLEEYPNLDYIVGTAVTAATAVKTLRSKGLNDQIKILSYYFTPDVYRGIKRGQILGAPTDSAVIQGRIAVDQMIRILEGKTYLKDVGPEIYVIDKNNINSFNKVTSLAPSGFRATYSVGVPRISD